MSHSAEGTVSLNPEEWTQKELIRHLYREIKEIQARQEKMGITLRSLEEDMQRRTILQEQQAKRTKVLIAGAGVAGSVIAFFVKTIIGY